MGDENTYVVTQEGKDYIQGFNEGYVITKHMPDLAEQIANVKTDAPRLEGFRDGREQFVIEAIKEREPKWMHRDLDKTQEPEEPSKDRDIEPEH